MDSGRVLRKYMIGWYRIRLIRRFTRRRLRGIRGTIYIIQMFRIRLLPTRRSITRFLIIKSWISRSRLSTMWVRYHPKSKDRQSRSQLADTQALRSQQLPTGGSPKRRLRPKSGSGTSSTTNCISTISSISLYDTSTWSWSLSSRTRRTRVRSQPWARELLFRRSSHRSMRTV